MMRPPRLRGAALRCALTLLSAASLPLADASAFCGFYVAQADTKLFNHASKVVLAWDAGRASVTMASDYEGDPKEFALVVPVPTVVKENDIRVVDPKLVDKLDSYSAPRLTEYFDEDPCRPPMVSMAVPAPMAAAAGVHRDEAEAKGVTIEARYEVGVYDILILSARDSDGLVDWLGSNHYRIPDGAGPVLGSYIRQGMHFFVAKVNLGRQVLAADRFLKPLQVTYETRKFMLPVRLGTVNARGPQDLVIFALTRRGRIEAANYQTALMDSGLKVPLFVRGDFGALYRDAFERRVAADGMSRVYTEHAWDMRGFMPCDPCAAPVPTAADLFVLGARWHYPDLAEADAKTLATHPLPPRDTDAFVTRLHLRYDAAHFPEDLVFVETGDRQNFQTIYKLTHPAREVGTCAAGRRYLTEVRARFAEEAKNLAHLTGRPETEILAAMHRSGETLPKVVP